MIHQKNVSQNTLNQFSRQSDSSLCDNLRMAKDKKYL